MTKHDCRSGTCWNGIGTTLENERVAEKTYRIRLETGCELPEITPGQFAMLRLPERSDPLLGRPIAVYRVDANRIDFVYLMVGKMTQRLACVLPGQSIEIWGPLGNGFQSESANTPIICVAGGIGQTPFLMHAAKLIEQGNSVTLLYGARSKERIACMDDFRAMGVDVRIATEDGSEGDRGYVTDLIDDAATPGSKILACGPHPMLRATFFKARELSLACEVSLESPMACGLGICFSCVVEYRNENGDWDFRRTCIDGPVFDAARLKWD